MPIADPMPKRVFYVVIEQDPDGGYVGEAPQLRGCFSQGDTLDELLANMREAILLCLEDEQSQVELQPQFVGVVELSV